MNIIKSLDIVDWCMVALIIALLTTSSWYAYQYEAPELLGGVGVGVMIGALTMGLGMSAREHRQEGQP